MWLCTLLQVTRLPVLPELCVFLTNRFLPYPVIMQKVRLGLTCSADDQQFSPSQTLLSKVRSQGAF